MLCIRIEIGRAFSRALSFLILHESELFTIILITKHEAELLREMIPSVHISMTSKRKKAKRKRYFVEEAPDVLYAVWDIRAAEVNQNMGG